MCIRRTRLSSSDSRGKKHPCSVKDLVAEMLREFSRRAKIDMMPEVRGKFVLHVNHLDKVRRMAWLELDENQHRSLA